MSLPRISIIIPLYNQSQKLMDCLASIKNQTFISPPSAREGLGEGSGEVEIILVNDGSTDITHEKLIEMVNSQLSHVNCFYRPNAGAPAARNRGFKESSGRYVIFCDADVVMKPDMLAKMSAVLDENPDASYAYSSFKFGWKKFRLWEFSAERLRQMPYIHTTSLIRREHSEGFSARGGPWDESLKRLQDWDLWLTMLEQGRVGKWIPEVLFSVKTGGTMSKWLPSFLARRDSAYQRAMVMVKAKHNL